MKQEKCHFKKDKVAATCSGYVDIPTGDEDALKEAVATQGAVSVAIDVTEDKFMFYKCKPINSFDLFETNSKIFVFSRCFCW